MKSGLWIRSGFTLVELLVVIIIIAILAAIAVPQFANSALEARERTMVSDLVTLRAAIDRYYHEHGSQYPGAVDHTDGIGSPGGDAAPGISFKAQLTSYSNRSGKTSTTLDRALYPLGPYLRTGIPANPLPEADAEGVVADDVWVVTGSGLLAPDGAAAGTGWKFNAETGQLIANSDDLSADGVRPYSDF